MITLDAVTVVLEGVTALDRVHLRVDDGEVVGVVGPNGSGKSTLLRVIAGTVQLHAGTITVDDRSWGPGRARAARRLGRHVAVVGQRPPAAVDLTVAELVLLGRTAVRGPWQAFTDDDLRVATAALERVDAMALADRPVRALSGGERQRVEIARALAQDAPHLLLDEPTNHLDVRHVHDLLDLVATVSGTTVLVLHDLNLAAARCPRLVLLDAGRIVADGPAAHVLDPARLEAVYGIRTARRDWDGVPHLRFGSAARPPRHQRLGAG